MGKAFGFIVQLVIVVVGVGWLISLIDAEMKCPWIFKSWRSASACVIWFSMAVEIAFKSMTLTCSSRPTFLVLSA